MAPTYAFNLYALPMALAGLAFLSIGVFVAMRRRLDAVGASFFLVGLSCFFWLAGFTGAFLSVDPGTAFIWDKYMSLLGTMWIPSTAYLFSVSLAGKLRERRGALAAAFAVSAFFSYRLLTDTPWMLDGMHRYFFGFYSAYGPGMKYFLLSFTGLVGACDLELYRLYSASTSGIERKQMNWVFLGFAVASFASVDYLPGYGMEVYPIGFCFILGLVACFAYAIEVYHLLDVRTALVQMAAYVATLTILLVPVVALVNLLHPAVRSLSSTGLSVVFAFILAASIIYWRWTESRVLKLFRRRHDALSRKFAEMYESIRFSVGLRETAQIAVDRLSDALDLYHGGFWQPLAGGGAVQLIASAHVTTPGQLDLPPTLRSRLSGSQEVQELRDLPRDQPSAAFLARVQAALVIPIPKGDGLAGFFVLGAKRSLQAFTGYELGLLNDFRERMITAFANAVMTDQLREMAGQVMLAEKRAREVEKVKADFLEAVSHELKTPLFAISGYAEALAGGESKGTEGTFAQGIHRAAMRIADLVADMIRAASLERESVQVSASWFDFAAASERILGPFRKKISLVRFVLDAPGQPQAFADRDKLEDVMFRLVSNAVKYSPPESAVTVWGRRDGTDFEFGVMDQGPGLSEEARKSLFEKFNRPYEGADEVNLRNPGSGLGLYICKTLVEMHKGTIALDETHRGCRIVVRLPQPAPPAAVPRP
jgi:signal transduction histidine kinase